MSHRPRTALVAALCLGFACLPLPAAAAAPSLDALQVSIGEDGSQWGMFGGDVDTRRRATVGTRSSPPRSRWALKKSPGR